MHPFYNLLNSVLDSVFTDELDTCIVVSSANIFYAEGQRQVIGKK